MRWSWIDKLKHVLVLSSQRAVKKKITARKKTPEKNLGRKNFLKKSHTNPIISPVKENTWECWQTFNPGVIYLDGKIHFLYRAIGHDGISRLGYAVSSDGLTIDKRLSIPVYEHAVTEPTWVVYSYFSGGSFGGVEDPRLTRVDGEDVLHMTYTACHNGLRVGLTLIKVNDFLKEKWKWTKPKLISPPNETHKNWVLFPEKIHGKYALLHSIKPTIQITYLDSLNIPEGSIKSSHYGSERKNCWDKWLRGAGAPPLKTDKGWLLFYHAMDSDWSKYKAGVMLLDLDDPTRVLYRAKKPVLAPRTKFENNGYKPGVVYISGAVVKDNMLYVYYGGADSFCCVAYAPLQEFLDALTHHVQPVLTKKKLKLK